MMNQHVTISPGNVNIAELYIRIVSWSRDTLKAPTVGQVRCQVTWHGTTTQTSSYTMARDM